MNPNDTTTQITKIHLFLFLFLFLFSNLMSRMAGINLNVLFYLVFLTMIPPALTVLRGNLPTFCFFGMLVVACFYTLFDTGGFREVGLVAKDFIVPMLTFLIGAYLYVHRRFVVNAVNVLYLPFVIYGLVQLLCVHLQVFDRMMPWDHAYVMQYMDNYWESTLGRGDMLRIFGVMNSFVEYQVSLVVLIFFIGLSLDLVQNRKLFWINVVLSLIFMVFSLERSPLAMFVIFICVWQHKRIFRDVKRLIKIVGIVTVLVTAVVVFDKTTAPEEHPLYGQQYSQLKNLVTLDFENDLAIIARQELAWKESMDLGLTHVWGIGVGRVSPSLLRPDMVGPHNGFLGHYLAFGLIGLLTLLLFLVGSSVQFSGYERSFKYFGFACMAAFSAMAMFNMPFIAKLGVLFFWMMGFICMHRPEVEDYGFQGSPAVYVARE